MAAEHGDMLEIERAAFAYPCFRRLRFAADENIVEQQRAGAGLRAGERQGGMGVREDDRIVNGVAIGADGVLDVAETQRLRAGRRAAE